MRPVLLCLLLSACGATATGTGPAGPAAPQRALLYPVGLTLLMSDRSLCVGHRPGRARDWTGQLSGCPHLLDYRVQGSDPAISRLELRPGAAGNTPTVSVAGQVFTAP